MRWIPVCALALLFATPTEASDSTASTSNEQKAVLITGASSGIGRLTAEHLAEAGYFVYAGARKQADIDELNAIDNIQALRLDVTVQSEIDAAVTSIEEQGRGLWGLVNNAGVNVIDPLIEADIEDMEFLFDVNVFGIFRVTKAFAPLIIEANGRIVNISSIAGVLAGGYDGYGMYIASKHAVEGLSDQLAWEMNSVGVSVSSVLPGGFASEIGNSRCKRMMKNQADKKYRYFEESMSQYIDLCRRRSEGEKFDLGPQPLPVAIAIEHALFAATPKDHYLVPGESDEARLTIAKLMEELVQLSLGNEDSVPRDDILDIYDNEMRIAKGEQPRSMPGFYEPPPSD